MFVCYALRWWLSDYTVYGKTFEGENSKVFPLNHLLCTMHNGIGLMHRESFPVNSVLCTTVVKVLPYTVQ